MSPGVMPAPKPQRSARAVDPSTVIAGVLKACRTRRVLEVLSEGPKAKTTLAGG